MGDVVWTRGAREKLREALARALKTDVYCGAEPLLSVPQLAALCGEKEATLYKQLALDRAMPLELLGRLERLAAEAERLKGEDGDASADSGKRLMVALCESAGGVFVDLEPWPAPSDAMPVLFEDLGALLREYNLSRLPTSDGGRCVTRGEYVELHARVLEMVRALLAWDALLERESRSAVKPEDIRFSAGEQEG